MNICLANSRKRLPVLILTIHITDLVLIISHQKLFYSVMVVTCKSRHQETPYFLTVMFSVMMTVCRGPFALGIYILTVMSFKGTLIQNLLAKIVVTAVQNCQLLDPVKT